MPLSTFPTDMSAAAAAVLQVAATLRVIRDQVGGDLQWSLLDQAQNGLRTAKIATVKALMEGQKQPAAAEAFMAGMGGPATLADFQAGLMDIEAKASAWNDRLAAFVASVPVNNVITVRTMSLNGVETRHIDRPAFIPAAVAEPLRNSTELAELVQAFDNLGA